MVLEMFFGELQQIVEIGLPVTSQLNLKEAQSLFYTITRQCNVKQSREGFLECKELGGLEADSVRRWPDFRPREMGRR